MLDHEIVALPAVATPLRCHAVTLPRRYVATPLRCHAVTLPRRDCPVRMLARAVPIVGIDHRVVRDRRLRPAVGQDVAEEAKRPDDVMAGHGDPVEKEALEPRDLANVGGRWWGR